MKLIIITILLAIAFSSCSRKIENFEYRAEKYNYFPVFSSSKIKPLKNEWKELYLFLKKGHILYSKESNIYLYSIEYYNFIRHNTLRIYDTKFLDNYNSIVYTFGEPSQIHTTENRILISYFPKVINPNCSTCTYDGLGYVFDKNTKKLLKE